VKPTNQQQTLNPKPQKGLVTTIQALYERVGCFHARRGWSRSVKALFQFWGEAAGLQKHGDRGLQVKPTNQHQNKKP
jgi:hypothetical protein